MIRAPLWLIGLLLIAAIGVGIYAYFTTPLPLGLSSVVRTPGGGTIAPTTPIGSQTPGAVGGSARVPAGQALVLGAVSLQVQSVQRNQDLTANGRGGPPGVFTVLDVVVQNAGAQPLTPEMASFRLLDDRGRTYAVDAEATRALNTAARRRTIFDASVPPGSTNPTYLAFATDADTNALSLEATLGYGELELPR